MKKFIIAAVLGLALVAGSNANAATFSSYLKVGSTGSEVTALQTWLVQANYLTMPAGVAKGYFGQLTKTAVAAWQASVGLPATGYFGPMSVAYANANSTGATTVITVTPGSTGCPAGAMFNSMTGASCSAPVTPVAGCSAGALFNSMTGASCTTTTTTTTTTTSGVEGTLDVRLASIPADNSNVRTQSDVPVYGLEFRSRIGDVAVQTVDLKVNVTNSSSSENPATLINTIKVWDGTTAIGTYPVSLTTFTKDQSQVYYYRISGLNFMVPKDATKVLTFSFSTNSIDNDRTVTISGYGASSIRATSGNSISSFYDASALSRSHTFKKPGTSTLTLSASGTTLRSMNYRVNGNDTLTGVTLGTFNLKSQSGASTLLTVNASTTVSGTAPSTLYLYNGSTLLKSKTYAASLSFDNLDTTAGASVAQSETPVTYTIKADFPSNTTNGTYASTTINSVVYQTPNGNNATATSSSSITNANQYVYTKAAVITLASAPTISVSNPSVSSGTTTMTATFNLNIQALGGNVIKHLTDGSEFTIVFSNGTNYTATAKSVVTIPNNDISDGSSAAVTVTASVNPSVALTNGLYNAALTSIAWNAGNGTTTQTYGLDDFKTSAAVQFNR